MSLRARIVNWIAPEVGILRESVRKLREALGGSLQTIDLLREDTGRSAGDWKKRDHPLMREVREAATMGGSGPSVKEVELKETFWEFDLAIDSWGWQREVAISQTEFSRWGLQQIILMCRLMAVKNPLIKRGVQLVCVYVFGRGFEISCDDEKAQAVLEEFLEDNKCQLGQIALTEKLAQLQTDGNLYWVFFTSPTGETKVRTIDALEVLDIIRNPEDSSEEWFIHRQWMQIDFDPVSGLQNPVKKEAYYPCIGYDPTDRPKKLGGYDVLWDSPVYHVYDTKIAQWKFAAPRIFAAIDWARAVKSFLEDWATITRALARFAWDVKTEGGVQAIASYQAVLATTLLQGGDNIERNPPPTVGSAHISGPNNTITPVKTANSTTGPEECRRLSLMVCAALGLPETMLWGDATTGSLATAQSLDRPTELMFLLWQEFFREMLQTICGYAIQMNGISAGGKLREAAKKMGKDEPDPVVVEVKFPAVLEHDIAASVGAIVNAATLQGYTRANTMTDETLSSLLLAELGVEDVDGQVDAALAQLKTATDKADQQTQDKNDAMVTAAAIQPKTPSKDQLEAIRNLQQVCVKLLKENSVPSA